MAKTPHQTDEATAGDQGGVAPYKVLVSTRFLVMSFIASVLGAFAVGQAARFILLVGPQRALFDANNAPKFTDFRKGMLPPPTAKDGKPIPHTIYTSKNFDTSRTASSSLLIRKDGVVVAEPPTCSSDDPTCTSCRGGKSEEEKAKDDDEDEHLPAGQHLLVDMKGIDSSFLDSEERLAYAMVEVVNQASLTLLSYHCHTLVPSGVSCVGVLLESHVSFHTWPSAGVITLDLFTCGSGPLLPVVPIIERLFGVPASLKEKLTVNWSHKLRGFRNEAGPLQMWDLGTNLLSLMDFEYKKEIVSTETKFQRIDVYDFISGRFNTIEDYEASLESDGSYHANNAELFLPDRAIFLDGIIQSSRTGERAYHESLVHPAMFAHPNPERVAIIGGGEMATLREVLKHNTVKDAVMIEIDEEMVNVSRAHLPGWSDCSDLEGSATWCGDDARAQIYYEDGLNWFISRYLDSENIKEKRFDVIIMDLLDPNSDVDFSIQLYQNKKFVTALYNALSEDGALVIQVGASPDLDSPREALTPFWNREIMIGHLEEAGFLSVHVYSQAHGGYTGSWNNLLAAKSLKVRKNFYRNEAEINLEMNRRSVRSKSGSTVFHYFDGATMQFFQMPSKRFETNFCRKVPTPEECNTLRGFNVSKPNAPIELFEVKKSGAGAKAGRGMFAKADIDTGSYIGLESSTATVDFAPSTFRLLEDMEETLSDYLTPLVYYMHGYGYQSQMHGDKEATVDSGITTFVNHGCLGTYNTGEDTGEVTEATADVEIMAAQLDSFANGMGAYNPVGDRRLRLQLSFNEGTLRDVKAGEEILDNYLAFIGHRSDWKEDILALRNQCNGQDAGDITKYEELEQEK